MTSAQVARSSAFLQGGTATLLSIALIVLAGLSAGEAMKRLRMPALIGYLVAGFLIGPFCLNWLDSGILSISAEIRRIALVIILMKAGLSLDLADLRRIGRPAVLLCFVPATCETLILLSNRAITVVSMSEEEEEHNEA